MFNPKYINQLLLFVTPLMSILAFITATGPLQYLAAFAFLCATLAAAYYLRSIKAWPFKP